MVLNDLNAAAAPHGLMFGADVATANRATLGGMIANNSAGARSVVHGLTADHVRALDGDAGRRHARDPAPGGARPAGARGGAARSPRRRGRPR